MKTPEQLKGAIRYDYPLLFEQKYIFIMAYTLETILAEKYETILHRNIGTTTF